MPTYYLLLFFGLLALLAIAVVSLWKHKKAGSGQIHVVGATALVETDLDPEGTILIDGELWRAKSIDGTSIAAQEQVNVVAVQGYLLLVRR